MPRVEGKPKEQRQHGSLGDKVSSHDKLPQRNRGRHGARNNNKTKDFVKWLQHTFPQVFSNNSNDSDCPPILDVAGGGKGELATRLAWCLQRRVIIVDPRPTDVVVCLQKHVIPQLPKKWQARATLHMEEAESTGTKPFQRMEQLVQQHQLYFTSESTLPGMKAKPNLISAIEESCLIVGMHADSATEAIVDAALHYKKPFVVVPCCVFPNIFNFRTVLVEESEEGEKFFPILRSKGYTDDSNEAVSGSPTAMRRVKVRSYEEFCEYILSKDERFKCSTLPFQGRNLAIWWDGC